MRQPAAWHARRCTPRTAQAGGHGDRARRAGQEGGAPARGPPRRSSWPSGAPCSNNPRRQHVSWHNHIAAAWQPWLGTPAVTSHEHRPAGGARRWRTCEAPRGPPRRSSRPSRPSSAQSHTPVGGGGGALWPDMQRVPGAPPSRRPLTTRSVAMTSPLGQGAGTPSTTELAPQRRPRQNGLAVAGTTPLWYWASPT